MPPIIEAFDKEHPDFAGYFEDTGYHLEWFGDYLGDFYEYVRQVVEKKSDYDKVFTKGNINIVLYRIFELVMREKKLIDFGIGGKIYDGSIKLLSLMLGRQFSYKDMLANQQRINISNPDVMEQYDKLWNLAQDFITELHTKYDTVE